MCGCNYTWDAIQITKDKKGKMRESLWEMRDERKMREGFDPAYLLVNGKKYIKTGFNANIIFENLCRTSVVSYTT